MAYDQRFGTVKRRSTEHLDRRSEVGTRLPDHTVGGEAVQERSPAQATAVLQGLTAGGIGQGLEDLAHGVAGLPRLVFRNEATAGSSAGLKVTVG